MKKDLSIIIPYLNEPDIYNTLDSLFSTISPNNCEVILIDDYSKDINDFSSYDLKYVRNKNRLGVAESRNLGVNLCSSEFAIFFDAHMRFQDGWYNKVLTAVSSDKDSVFCTSCASLNKDCLSLKMAISYGYGAGISLIDGDKILEAKWITLKKDSPIYEVPCILGACYAFNVEKFNKLKGLEGLLSWGSDEIFLSLKYWLSGGSCKIVSDAVTGHIFRDVNSNYPVSGSHPVYNKMFICSTILPENIGLDLIKRIPQNNFFNDAVYLFRRNMGQIFEYKKYYQTIFSCSFCQVCEKLDIKIPDVWK